MIESVTVKNYKCLRDVTVALERLTMFVGPNASGKSSILQGLDLLCRAFEADPVSRGIGSPPGPVVFGFNLSESTTRGVNGLVEVSGHLSQESYRYRAPDRTNPPPGSPFTRQLEWTGVAIGPPDGKWKPWHRATGQSSTLPLSILLRLEVSKLLSSFPGQSDASIMSPDGTGLHSALASMTFNDPDSWNALQKDLRRIVPTIRRLRHTKLLNFQQPTSVLFDTIGAESLPASQVSEGTLLVLGLLTAMYAPNRPGLILLDDLDRGLHPKAQRELIALLRGLLDTNPGLQIIATTHSPYMLDWVGEREVRMTYLKDDGTTVCAALTSHPQYPKWKDEFHPGEMWSLFGEKWVAEPEVTEQ